jgi:hypothetical protein
LRQTEEIESKTLGLDSWKLTQTVAVEESFPIPESCWLSMEEGIRQRIHKPESVWSLSLLTWKPALASLMLLLSLGIAYRLYLKKPEVDKMAQEKVNQLKQDEILIYLTESPDNLDLSQQLAVQSLPDNALEIPVDYNTDELLEENNLNETDFESSL